MSPTIARTPAINREQLARACAHCSPLVIEYCDGMRCHGIALDVFRVRGNDFLRISTRDGLQDIRMDLLLAATPST
ncbi:hypothetical protein ACTSKR_03035 [Chitinibacteraceae bacterium HSL-7]